MRHAFAMQNPAEIFVVLAERVGLADGQHHIHIPQMREPLAHVIRQKMGRRLEIDVFVVIAFEKVRGSFDVYCQVVASGEGGQLAKEKRMSHGNVHGMVGAEAASMHDDTWMRILETHEWEDIVI
jgi:hypothetical protein